MKNLLRPGSSMISDFFLYFSFFACGRLFKNANFQKPITLINGCKTLESKLIFLKQNGGRVQVQYN